MSQRKSAFNLQTCARPNILALEPYRCARDDYKDDGTNILLDANENAYGPGLSLSKDGKINGASAAQGDIDVDLLGLNRYPDPHQLELKQLLCNLRNTDTHTSTRLTPQNLFVGVGSDEAIDNLLRAFCVPGHDKILTCPPTYGMYAVSAQVNDVAITKVPLALQADNSFEPDVPAIMDALTRDKSIKLVYFCSPGNPTGQLVPKAAVDAVLQHPSWNGVVVVDEAYVDFAGDARRASLAQCAADRANLVVMQTLSKAFGLAGIRLGAAFASPAIARLLNSLKAPYNVSQPTSRIATAALGDTHLRASRAKIAHIKAQRERLVAELPRVPGVGGFKGGFDANFLLVEMLGAPRERGGEPSNEVALRVYERLAEERGVVVRFRGKEVGCLGCLRVTVGTEKEVDRFLGELRAVLEEVYANGGGAGRIEEERREREANGVVA